MPSDECHGTLLMVNEVNIGGGNGLVLPGNKL